MNIVLNSSAPFSLAAAPVASPFHGVPLATLHYVIRQVDGSAVAADIEAREFFGVGHHVTGGFQEAVVNAQRAASILQKDGIHPLPVNQAQAVMQAADGAFWVVPLGGPHRGVTGPTFIDGALYDSAGLAVWAEKHDDRLQAIVGTKNMIDLRQFGNGGLRPIDLDTL